MRSEPDRGGVLQVPDTAMSAAIRSSPLLGRLPSDDLEAVLERGRIAQFPRGRSMWRTDFDRVIVVLDGIATAVSSTAEGQQVIVALLGVGEPWGVGVACDGVGPHSGIEVTASSRVTAFLLSGRDLRELARARPSVAHACLAVVSAALVRVRYETIRFAHTSTAERVARRLLELADRWGEPDRFAPDRVRIRRTITQEELGSWAQASRESASKALHDLRLAGIVETRRRELVILDLPRLRHLLEDGVPAAVEDWTAGVLR